MRLGYCCINLSLRDQGVTINRGMIKRTWEQHGTTKAGELAEANLMDLLTILRWNVDHGIHVYRMSSDIFPWMSEYRLEDLPNFARLEKLLAQVGMYVDWHGLRISFHPGQFDVLASPNEQVVQKTIWDLDQHARIMDLMGLPQSYEAPINIHIGGAYGDKFAAMERFCFNFERLAKSTQARLVVENDDKPNLFGVDDLHQAVYSRIGTPITFDHLHHRFCTNDLSAEQAALIASSTWNGHRAMQHYSSAKRLYEDAAAISRSHADYVYEQIPDYGLEVDVEIEAKAKDLAVLRYREQHPELAIEPIKFDFE